MIAGAVLQVLILGPELAGGGFRYRPLADVFYVLAGSETYRQLVVERGWLPAQFEEWLVDSVRRLLLAEP